MPAAEREQINRRRVELIQQEAEVGLSPEEAAELAQLQTEWAAYLKSVAPLPWDKLNAVRESDV